jgi:hypothetical protein
MQPLLAIEAREHPSTELLVVDVREQVAGLGDSAKLLDRLLEPVLATKVLELGDD